MIHRRLMNDLNIELKDFRYNEENDNYSWKDGNDFLDLIIETFTLLDEILEDRFTLERERDLIETDLISKLESLFTYREKPLSLEISLDTLYYHIDGLRDTRGIIQL